MSNDQLIEQLVTLAEGLSERVTTLEAAAAKKSATPSTELNPYPSENEDPIDLARAAIRRGGW